MEKQLLFTRIFNKEMYYFYLANDRGTQFLFVETPENAFGYTDIVLFTHTGTPYSLWRYLQPWILREIKNTLIRKGYVSLVNGNTYKEVTLHA